MKQILFRIGIFLILIGSVLLTYSCSDEFYTRPYPVNSLEAEVGPARVILSWSYPKDTSSISEVHISWADSSGEIDSISSENLERTMTIDDLGGSIAYTFSVWLVDIEGVESSKVQIEATPLRSAGIAYVDASASGSKNGTSWANAFTSLEDALEATYIEGDQIWVAAGTYHPDGWNTGGGTRAAVQSNDRFKHFYLRNGVSLYGGFAGGETSIAERDWERNQTILSADLDDDDEDSDNNGYIEANMGNNAVHVIYLPNTLSLNETAVLDGFYIQGGNADLAGHVNGGGLYSYGSSPTIRNCVFKNNAANERGAALFACNSEMVLDNVSFIYNRACACPSDGAYGGGGACFMASAVELTGCSFSNNFSTQGAGACLVVGEDNEDNDAEYENIYSVSFTDCIFRENNANQHGGALYVIKADTSFSSVQFIDNRVDNCTNITGYGGGGAYFDKSNITMTGCLFTGNYSECDGAAFAMEDDGDNTISYTAEIIDCVFYGNYTTSYGTGGAVYNWQCGLNATNSVFAANSAYTACAILLNGANATMSLDSCIVWANTLSTPDNWYAIRTYETLSSPVMNNCVIQNDYDDGTYGMDINSSFTGSGNSTSSTDTDAFNIHDGDGEDDIWYTADDGIWLMN